MYSDTSLNIDRIIFNGQTIIVSSLVLKCSYLGDRIDVVFSYRAFRCLYIKINRNSESNYWKLIWSSRESCWFCCRSSNGVLTQMSNYWITTIV